MAGDYYSVATKKRTYSIFTGIWQRILENIVDKKAPSQTC